MESSNTPHLRSASLPSRITTSFSQIEINLNKLKTVVPFYSSTSVRSGLVCLVDLYFSIDELIGSAQTQQVNLQYMNKVLIEDSLVGSTGLLDSYSNLVDLLAQTKENVRALQFALRRRGMGTYASSEDQILDYVLSRKKVKKNIIGCLGSMEQMEREIESCLIAGEDHHLTMVIGALREIAIATISVFRALLVILSGKTKLDKGFSLITKLMRTGRPSCDKSQEIVNDAGIIDATLHSIRKDNKKNKCKTVEVQMVMERLQNLNGQIEGYEVGLDSLFRKLIRTRVSLLNILAN